MGGTGYGWLAVLVLFAVAPAGAQEHRGKEPPTLEEQARENERITKQTIAHFSSMSDFVGAMRLSDKDARLVIVHYPSFADLYWWGEKPLEVRVRESFEKSGRYDFSLVADAPEFLSWAEQKKLDGKAWLRSAFRATLLSTRAGLSEGLAEYRRQIALLEKMAGDEGDADLD
ncbi:MAG: hypothetical protein MUE73_08725, partial [Planctomycetes bacterium]|nr:hypothetical protein [Planctomycetota bacterium]